MSLQSPGVARTRVSTSPQGLRQAGPPLDGREGLPWHTGEVRGRGLLAGSWYMSWARYVKVEEDNVGRLLRAKGLGALVCGRPSAHQTGGQSWAGPVLRRGQEALRP